MNMSSLYEIKVKDTTGKDVSLSDFKGKVLLVVNTATKCGLAPQYEELQNLYEKYKKNGFYVLDFPSNQFLQSPESNEGIEEFCTTNYGTTFPRFDKVNVNGQHAAPLYKYLRKQKGGLLSDTIKWNFTKFLLDREGNVVKRYAPTVTPSNIEDDIKRLL